MMTATLPTRPVLSAATQAVLSAGLPPFDDEEALLLAAVYPWPTVEYRSPEFNQLHVDDPRRHDAMVRAAEAWSALRQSPHVRELVNDWIQWRRRSAEKQAATAGSVARAEMGWTPNAPTYAELAVRRSRPAYAARCPECMRTRRPGYLVPVRSLPHPPSRREQFCLEHGGGGGE